MEKPIPPPAPCRAATLLPYLQPRGAGEHLKLSLLEGDGPGVQRSYPFRLLDDSAPYSRVLEAAVVTDAGTVVKRVSLQLQKDHYPTATDLLRRVCNRDVDTAWQEAYAHQDDDDAVFFCTQTDPEGRLVPQAPLFYCRQRQEFFNPVCPSCGLPLSLCRDDEYLVKSGLAPYATSLKRYLYCRACCQFGLQEIYLYERDHADPLSLKDRWSLMEKWGAVDGTLDPEDSFPCARCGERDACFGPEHLVRTRMLPFSFYPFHMLLRTAPSLQAADFLARLSGAPPDALWQWPGPELPAGEETTLYPAADSRSFLEILFLKLSFLHEVLLQALSRGQEAARVSMERIWVTLAPLSRRLPLLWNFKVTIFDSIAPASPATLRTERSAHLGLIWFRTLVSNRYVTGDELLQAVVNHLLPDEAGGQTPGGKLAELLVPENIFWDRDVRTVPEEGRSTWEKACSLGLGLVDGSRPVPPEELLGPLAALLTELKGAMLEAPAAAGVPPPSQDNEEVLCSVVVKLIARYKRVEQCQDAHETDEFEGATAIIPPHPHAGPTPTVAEDPLMETVVFPHVTRQGAPPEAEWDEPFLETVVLSPGAGAPAYPAARTVAPEPQQEGSDLLETVLVTPPRGREKQG